MAILEDVLANSDRILNKEKTKICSWWFVAAHTINGGRFYSEPFKIFDEACKEFNRYEDVVQWFGGGHVELLRISDYDYDVIAYSRV